MTDKGNDWLEKPILYKQCPKCQRHDLDTRIPRGAIVKLFLFWKPYKRYRCGNCAAKVYILESKSKNDIN